MTLMRTPLRAMELHYLLSMKASVSHYVDKPDLWFSVTQ